MSTGKNKNNIIDYIVLNKDRILIGLLAIFISFISFEIGVLQGMEWKADPIVIEKVPGDQVVKLSEKGKCLVENRKESIGETKVLGVVDDKKEVVDKKESCIYVGSKNSDKIHKKDCQWADRIKEENRVCFSSVEEAQKSGYIPGSCMK